MPKQIQLFDVKALMLHNKPPFWHLVRFGIPLQFDKVYTEGISKITATR